ncbi:MAG: serine hydrolase domain-containing protein [Flavobacteriales bacterium]
MKKVIISVLSVIFILFISLFVSGKTYLLKAFKSTYLSGHSTAHIHDKSSFDLAEVKKGTPQEWSLSTGYNQKSLTPKLNDLLTSQKSIGFLTVKNGEIDFENYWDEGGVNVSTNTFSMSKSIVGMLLGIAMQENKIQNVFQPVSDFLPEFTEGVDESQYFNHKLEIRHLLSMTAGLEWNEDYYSVSQTSEAYYGDNIKTQMLNLKVVKEPGSEFEYQSAASQLLGMVIENATGQSLAEYASQHLWKKIGSENDATWHTDNQGNELAFCCFNTTIRDMAKLGQLFLNKGKWNNEQVLPEPFIDISTQPSAKSSTYGYQWWIYDQNNTTAYYMKGHLGQYLIVIPDMDLVVVRFGHKHSKNDIEVIISEIKKMYS